MKKTYKCRCCLSSGCEKDLSTSYLYDGKSENYGEMLKITFDLSVNLINTYICEKCILRLRDSATFKQQILDTEIALNQQIQDNETDIEERVKFEINNVFSDDSCRDVPDVKTQDELKNIKKEEAESLIILALDETDKVKHNKKRKAKPAEQIIKKTNTEKDLHKQQRENSIKLISNSNLCIFKSLRTRFACYVCNEKFFDIIELRKHSNIHTKEDFQRRFRRLRGKSYENVDITSLMCEICLESCDNLDILRKHLSEEHAIKFEDTNHILIPFKLQDGFTCEICKDRFNTFTSLTIHMNTHATSNVCEVCGISFFNRSSLRNHIRSIHKEHKCLECGIKFDKTTKFVCHKRKFHNAAPVKHYCLRCKLTFRYPYQLKRHMVENHGGKYNTVQCTSCKKTFKDQNLLKIHFRSVHLNERNFQCSVCDLRFFSRNDRKRHEKTHERGSMYACGLCETKFKSKDSVGRHMKRQHGVKK